MFYLKAVQFSRWIKNLLRRNFKIIHTLQALTKNILIAAVLVCVSQTVIAAETQSHAKHAHAIAHKKKIHHRHHAVHKKRKTAFAQTHPPEDYKILADSSSFNHSNASPAVATSSIFSSSIEGRLVEFVEKTIASIRYSSYKLGGTRFDPTRGIYVVDCSTYVDHILEAVCPQAYSSLANSTGSDKPTTEHYYDFFARLTDTSNHYWDKIEDVEELRPGDILVFRNKKSRMTGHVMVVMDKPVRDTDAFLVRVADSAPVGHSQDTREQHTSGIGIGTLLLKVNPDTGQPSAYAWRLGSSWKRNVNIAMARPYDSHSKG